MTHQHVHYYHSRVGKKLRSTSQATTDIHFFPFHSAQLIILLVPFLKFSSVTEMFPTSQSVAIPGQVLLTFIGFLSVLSAINGDLCLGVKHLIYPNPKKQCSAFVFKVKFTLGCFFNIKHIPQQFLWLSTFPLWRCYLAMQIAQYTKRTWQWESLMDYCTNRESDECLLEPCENSMLFWSICDKNMAEACGDLWGALARHNW